MKSRACNNCGKQIREPVKGLGLDGMKWIHTDGMIRCDGVSKRRAGFNKAKKADYHPFRDYLKEIENDQS